jgi:predicted ATPase/class 3 adenylate cyclase
VDEDYDADVSTERRSAKPVLQPLPTGTVTFLFTDIEGSTRLAARLGDRFPSVLAVHHAILRDAIAGEGIVISTEGDAFFAVFPDAADAVAAAVRAQHELGIRSAGDSPIRIRMGLHTGRAVLGGDNYTGLDVVLAARIMAAAHGGQVLLSEATAALTRPHLPAGVRLRMLGSYRLKDFPSPERLHQLEVVGLASEFPPLRALDVRRAHLPPEATTFIGRARELDALGGLLTERRLVTLTGPGGTGKTRLALRAAADAAGRFADGAFFVSLAAIRDATLLTGAIASALNLRDDPLRSSADILRAWLGSRELLLVLDNLEQISDAGGVVDDLLASAPGLQMLATSRSPLRLAGEQEYRVRPFSVPKPGADVNVLEASDAVQLFLDRARLARADLVVGTDELAVIAEICTRLDGLPLTIELAAARVRLLQLTAIRERLGHRLDVLARGPSNVSARQQSLRGAIAWSHDLLDEPQRALFHQLGVFVSGWTIEAAEAVAVGPRFSDVESALETIADQSLIQPALAPGGPRFTMLETIREFALEQLDAAGEVDEINQRHAAFFRRLAETALAESRGADAAAWFDRLEADLDNLRAAIERSSVSGNVDVALAISAALGPFWLQRNHSAEGQRTLIRLIDRADERDSPEFAAATAVAGFNANWLADLETAFRMGELSVSAYRRLGDRRALAEALSSLSFATIARDPVAAVVVNDESVALYRDLGDVRGEGQALLARATAQFVLGRMTDARATVERSIELSREAGDIYFEIFSSNLLARIKHVMGDVQSAVVTYRSTLERSRFMDLSIGVAMGLENVAELAIQGGDVERGIRLGAVAERLKEELGGGAPSRMVGALDPLAEGRRRLAIADFERERAAGRAMEIDPAIEEAVAATVDARSWRTAGSSLASHGAVDRRPWMTWGFQAPEGAQRAVVAHSAGQCAETRAHQSRRAHTSLGSVPESIRSAAATGAAGHPRVANRGQRDKGSPEHSLTNGGSDHHRAVTAPISICQSRQFPRVKSTWTSPFARWNCMTPLKWSTDPSEP